MFVFNLLQRYKNILNKQGAEEFFSPNPYVLFCVLG